MVLKPNIAMHIGMVSPPPPIPPLKASPNRMGKIKIAQTSK